MHTFGNYYGWRGKFGFIAPSFSDTVYLELYKMLPDGVLMTCVDQKVQNLVDADFDKVMKYFEDAVRILDYEEVEAIIIGGPPAFLRVGFDTPELMIKRVTELTGKPASTSATAEVNAFRALDLRRLIMVTPLKPHINELLKRYLEYEDFEVVTMKGASIEKNAHIVKYPPDKLYQLVHEAVAETSGSFDGIFIECPRWAAVHLVATLEDELGVPIVTTAQALAREALTLLHINEVRPNAGRLFRDFVVR